MKKILLLILLIFCYNSAYSFEAHVEYDGILIDYSSLNYHKWSNQGVELLTKAQEQKNKVKRNEIYGKAAGAYQTLIKIDCTNAVNTATLGHIYGKMGVRDYAIGYLDKALNLSNTNPIVNNYYAIFYYDERDYRHALKYFQKADKYNFTNKYELYNNLACCYAKLGELTLARKYYQKAYAINPSKNLKSKLAKLDNLTKSHK